MFEDLTKDKTMAYEDVEFIDDDTTYNKEDYDESSSDQTEFVELKVAEIVDLAGIARYKVILSKADSGTYRVQTINIFNQEAPVEVYCQDSIVNLHDAELLYMMNIQQFKFLFEEDVHQARSIDTYKEAIQYHCAECCGTCKFSKWLTPIAPGHIDKRQLVCFNNEIFNMDKDHSNDVNFPMPNDLIGKPEQYQQDYNKNITCSNAVREAIARKCHAMKQYYYEFVSQLGIHPTVDQFHVCKLYNKKEVDGIVVCPQPPMPFKK